MRANTLWQNPFVDVFKSFKILELKEFVEQSGKVSIV